MRSITVISALFASMQLLAGTALAAGGWTWPVRGPVLTEYLNGDDPYAGGQHRGIDIGAPVGARVVASSAGTVTFAGVVGSSGLTVSERTADGRFDLSYLHLSAATVHAGDRVDEGAPLGAVGTSGRRSSAAPHLHFGVRDAGQRAAYRDPADFLAPPPAEESPRPAPSPVPVAEPAAAATAGPAPVAVHAPLPSPLTTATAAPLLPPRILGVTHGRANARVLHSAQVHPHAAAGAAAPFHGLGPARHAAGAHHATPRSGVTSEPARGPAGVSHNGSAQPSHHAGGVYHQTGDGIDLGWLVACLGLVLAATLLAHPDHARRVARRGRSGLGALLRPTPRGS